MAKEIMKKSSYKIPRVLNVESLHTAFVKYLPADYSYAGEIHDFWELVYVFDGNASIVKNDKIYVLNKGDIVFHPPMEFHRIWSNNSPFAAIFISFTARGDAIKALGENIYNIDILEHKMLFDIKKEIEDTYKVENNWLYTDGEFPLSHNVIALKLELFMLELLKRDISSKKAESGISGEFSKISNVFLNNIDKDLSVSELASLTYLGESNLKKICHKYTGMGPAKYFLHIKIAHATALLKTGRKVTEISEALGFSSQSYFSAVYKRETGKSPREVKK